MIREGGTIDVTLTFSKMDGVKDVVLLPMGRSDDGAQYVFSFLFTYGRSFDGVMTSSVNEKLDEDNFFNGVSCPDSQVTSFLIISID